MSTLAHEMAHLWQHHFGKPSRAAYHNKEWAEKMHEIGLAPSSTGQPGGKETGQKVSHYIEQGGAFARAFAEIGVNGFDPLYVELWDAAAKSRAKRKEKSASKSKYTCEECGMNAWAKPGVNLMCGDCEAVLICAEGDD